MDTKALIAKFQADFESQRATAEQARPLFVGKWFVGLRPLDGSRIVHLENTSGRICVTHYSRAQVYSTQARASQRLADFAGNVPAGYALEVFAADYIVDSTIAALNESLAVLETEAERAQ